jgi:hypothetical protein
MPSEEPVSLSNERGSSDDDDYYKAYGFTASASPDVRRKRSQSKGNLYRLSAEPFSGVGANGATMPEASASERLTSASPPISDFPVIGTRNRRSTRTDVWRAARGRRPGMTDQRQRSFPPACRPSASHRTNPACASIAFSRRAFRACHSAISSALSAKARCG